MARHDLIHNIIGYLVQRSRVSAPTQPIGEKATRHEGAKECSAHGVEACLGLVDVIVLDQ